MSQLSPSVTNGELSGTAQEKLLSAEPAPSSTHPGPQPPRRWTRPRYRQSILFRLTAEGIMLLIIAALVGFAAWHSGANLLYLLFSIHIAAFLLNGFMLSINLTRLRTIEHGPELVVAGQPFIMTVALNNKKRLFSSRSILVTHYLDKSRTPLGIVHFMQVPPASTSEETYQATIPRRGLHTITRSAVTTRYPFGFEERGQVFKTSQQFLALPETFPVTSAILQAPLGFGDQESNVRGSGTDLYGLREYVQGEPARHVHWRTSARAQKLMVAEYTREERRQLYLLLDNTAPDHSTSAATAEAFEKAVTLTASLARHFIETGYEVGLVTQEGVMTARQGAPHLTAILKHLALISLTENQPLPPVNNSLQIIFHSDQIKRNGNGPTIDSRDWHPPHQYRKAGEKSA